VRFAGGSDSTRHLHPRGAAEVLLGDHVVGRFGPLHPDVVESFDLGGPAMAVEIDLEALEALGSVVPRYRTIPRLPPVTRDLSLVRRRQR
jgi:phenylalanyl-tRNA synthetase beta chain